MAFDPTFGFSANFDSLAAQIPKDLVKYVKEVGSRLGVGRLNLDRQSAELMLQNVYEEIKGSELAMSGHFDCSKVLESMIQQGTKEMNLELFSVFANHVLEMAQHQFASHVLQTLIQTLAKDQADKKVGEKLDLLVNRVKDHPNLVNNLYSNHIVRTLLMLKSLGTIDGLSTVVLTVPKDFASDACDQLLSPVLQIILDLGNQSSEKIRRETRKLISKNPEWFVATSKDRVGSRFMEVFFKHTRITQKLYDKCIKIHLLELLRHRNGNFVLQAIIRQVQDASILRSIVEETINELERSVQKQRFGVVVEIVRCFKRCGSHSSRLNRALKTLFRRMFGLSTDRQLISAIARLGTDTYHLQGCLAASTLVTCPNHGHKYAKSLAKMEMQEIYCMATDSKASHVVSSFLSENTDGNFSKYRASLVNRILKPRNEMALVDLACDKYGSYIVDQICSLLDSEQRNTILQRLGHKLSHSRYGQIVKKNLCGTEKSSR